MSNYDNFSILCRTMKERTLEYINNPLSEDSGADTDTETDTTSDTPPDTTTAATDTTSAAADTTTAATAASDTTTATTPRHNFLGAPADAVKEYENITNTSGDLYKYFLDLTLYYITYTEYYGLDTIMAVNVWQGSGKDSIGNFLRTSAKEANEYFGLHAPIKNYDKQLDNIYYQILITFLKNTEHYKKYYDNMEGSANILFTLYFEESSITGDLVMNPRDTSLNETLRSIGYPVLTKPPPTPISNTEIVMWINGQQRDQQRVTVAAEEVHKKCWFGIDCNRTNPYHIDEFHRGVATPAAAERLRLRRTQRQQTGQTGPIRRKPSYRTNRQKGNPFGGKRTRKKKRHQKKRTATSIKKCKRYRHARKKTKRKTKTKTKKR